jgi:hypothetical protein
VADPSLQPNSSITIVLGQPYNLSTLFTLNSGTARAGDTALLGARVNFNDNETFFGTPETILGYSPDYWPYVLEGSYVYFGDAGDFSAGSVVFTTAGSLGGYIQFIDSTPEYPGGYVYADAVNYSFHFAASLFTNSADTVNFNSLQPAQQSAIATGSTFYAGLGGSDNVTLPNEATYNTIVGNGKTLGWTDTSASTFYTNSQISDTYNVSGGDGNYYIVEGAGTEFITITGNGNSHITGGSGVDIINLNGTGNNVVTGGNGDYYISLGAGTDFVTVGNGNNNITGYGGNYDVSLGAGTDNVTINGNGVSTVIPGTGIETLSISGGGALEVDGTFVGSASIGANSTLELNGAASGGTITFNPGTGETLKIDGITMPTNVISGFIPGDYIDFAGVPFDSQGGYTLFETSNNSAHNNVLQLIENGITNSLSLDPTQQFSGGFHLFSDGSTGTAIRFVSGPVEGYSTLPAQPLSPQNPYAAVVVISSGDSVGTGFIIGPHTILTAAHVVDNGQPISIGLNNGTPINLTSRNTVHIDPLHSAIATTSLHDLALIDVTQDLSSFGQFGINPSYAGGTVNVSGYPTNLQNNYIVNASSTSIPGLLTFPLADLLQCEFSSH